MKEKKIDEKPKKGRMIMWAFIYSGVFIAALIIGVVSKFVQPSWTKDFTAEWSDPRRGESPMILLYRW